VEGKIQADTQVKISKSGYVLGEIKTKRLIINGYFEGTCYAEHIEILSCGSVNGEVYSDNLSIESGGKFMGITTPSEKPEKMLGRHEEQEEAKKVTLLRNHESNASS